MKHTHRYLLAALACGTLVATGCTSVTESPGPDRTVHITASNLPVLDSTAMYEAWVSIPTTSTNTKGTHIDHGNSAYVGIGTFTVSSSGAILALDGSTKTFKLPNWVIASVLEDALITVERRTKTDTIPGARLLSGSFVGTASQGLDTLTLNGDDAFNGAFATIDSGHAALDMPTTAANTDFESGIWFVQTGGSSITTGLKLPKLPTVTENPFWHYQAWLVPSPTSSNSTTIPLGAFHDPNAADGTGAGPGAGPLTANAYAMPGEDFVTGLPGATLLDGRYGVVVSMEPDAIASSRPMLVLLSLVRIPTTAQRLQPFALAPLTQLPQVTMTVNR